MAIVNIKSSAITDGDAATQPNISQLIAGGRLRESVGVVKIGSGDAIGSVYRLVRVSSHDRLSRVLLSCDAITACAGDVGVYDIAAVNNGEVIDADFFASAKPLSSTLVNHDVVHEAAVAAPRNGFALADIEKSLWRALGLASDPNKLYDIAVTLTAAAGSVGAVAIKVHYVDGN